MTKFKIICASVILVAGVMASLLVQRRALARLRESDTPLEQQDNQLAEN